MKSKIIGYNSKLSTIDASILNIRIKHLNWYIKKRNLHANLYRKLLQSKHIKFQLPYNNSLPVWRNFPIRIKKRNYIYNELFKKKFKVKLNYLPPNHLDICYSKFKKNIKLPITEKISSEIINLPCHPYMKINEICVRTCSSAAKALDQKMRSAKRSGPPQTSSFFKLCRFLDFEKRGDVFRIESRLVNECEQPVPAVHPAHPPAGLCSPSRSMHARQARTEPWMSTLCVTAACMGE